MTNIAIINEINDLINFVTNSNSKNKLLNSLTLIKELYTNEKYNYDIKKTYTVNKIKFDSDKIYIRNFIKYERPYLSVSIGKDIVKNINLSIDDRVSLKRENEETDIIKLIINKDQINKYYREYKLCGQKNGTLYVKISNVKIPDFPMTDAFPVEFTVENNEILLNISKIIHKENNYSF